MERFAFLHTGSAGESIAALPPLKSALNAARKAGRTSDVTEYTRRIGLHETNIRRAGRTVPGEGRRSSRGSEARGRTPRGKGAWSR